MVVRFGYHTSVNSSNLLPHLPEKFNNVDTTDTSELSGTVQEIVGDLQTDGRCG